jgi:hypothetical protein
MSVAAPLLLHVVDTGSFTSVALHHVIREIEMLSETSKFNSLSTPSVA